MKSNYILAFILCFFVVSCQKAEKQDAEFLLNLGSEYLKIQKFEDARKAFQGALEINPKLGAAYNNIARTYIIEGQMEKVLEYANKAVKAGAANAITFDYQGLSLFRQGNKLEGIQAWKNGIKLEPNNFKLLNNLGSAYKAVDDYVEARGYFKKALAASPGSSLVIVNLADTYRQTGEFAEGITILDSLLEKDPGNFFALNAYGHLLKDQKKWEGAAVMFKRGREVDPSFSPLYYNLAYVLVQRNDLGEAEKGCKKALAAGFLDPGTTLQIAKLFLEVPDKIELVKRLLSHIIEIDSFEAEEAKKLIAVL